MHAAFLCLDTGRVSVQRMYLRSDTVKSVLWHADDRGAFSMQVLQKALDVFGLSCQNLDSPECMESAQHPENEVAFICNLRVSCSILHVSCLDCICA